MPECRGGCPAAVGKPVRYLFVALRALSTQGLDFHRTGQAIARQGCVAGACVLVILENWGLRGAGLLVLRLDVRRIVVYLD